jgi:asparagine synthase (glutamine-hydrolysing)
MCGIAGVFDYGRSTGSINEGLLQRMSATIAHRGPDDDGIFLSRDGRLGLAHRRLSIVDLAGGSQPMAGPSGEMLVFNGEIYNYPRLRTALEAQGVHFRTTCDTEVILHLYERHGEDCVLHLDGMFAFALWDPGRQRLFFARDRVGEKPFYWADREGTFVFASEIKAILEHPSVTPSVDTSSIGPYFANLVVPSPSTLYAGIFKLAPGTLGTCDTRGVRVRPYWSLFSPRSWRNVDLREAAHEIRQQLTMSVRDRLMADVPVGVLLSGGLDSTTLVALLEERAADMATFSVGSDDPRVDERDEARRVANRFGTRHHEVVLSEADAMGMLGEIIHFQDEPLADPVCLPLHAVCRLAARNDTKVVLAGEGSDELFWGYPSYRRHIARLRSLRALLKLPSPARKALSKAVPARGRFGRYHDVLVGVASGRLNPMHAPVGLSSGYRDYLLEGGDTGLGWAPTDGHGRAGPLDLLAFDTQEYEFGLRLPELLLMRIDRFSMANGVEARAPFLAPALVELAYRLPPSMKMSPSSLASPEGLGKVVLREAVRDVVPELVRQRGKQGFAAPIASWFSAGFGPLLMDLASSDAARKYLVPDALRALVGRHMSGRADHALVLWPVLNFLLWHRRWIEGVSSDELVVSSTRVG